MKLRLLVCILFSLIFKVTVSGQSETYSIKRASFSSYDYDEFCPVYYKGGIVFCSNKSTGLAKYETANDMGFFKIYFVDTVGRISWQSSRLFSKFLTTNLNDGPVTFNSRGDTIIYSRNLEVSGNLQNISSPRNKLGLFSAVLLDGKWTKIRELRFNNEWYNCTTPCLSPDGKKLYFASDKPGGYGGFDIYLSQWRNDYWTDAVNLGPVINTKGNEAYPFITSSGELLFSSDGHEGLGGKDIFFSSYTDTTWLKPVRLDPPVNSKSDDFGFITDSLFESGYFSSNRDKSVDVFEFRTNVPQIFYTAIQKENQYCFSFSDSGEIAIDTLNLKYEWDFGDNSKSSGKTAVHCFSGPGNYKVKLNIIDKITGNLFFSKLQYRIDLADFVQPYINSTDMAITGHPVDFDALKSNLPGYKILNYSWDFGDGTKMTDAKVVHTFTEAGEYNVNLGVTLKSDSTGRLHKTGSSKKVTILNDGQTGNESLTKKSSGKSNFPKIENSGNAHIYSIYSAETEVKEDAEFRVQLFSSKNKIDINSTIFRNVPKKYTIEEIFDQDSSAYCYVSDHQINLMDTYMTYSDLMNSGYGKSVVKVVVIKDPASRELYGIKKIFGTSSDAFFDKNNRLTSTAYLLLDQLVRLLNKYPAKGFEIKVHTDNEGSPDSKLELSKLYAGIIRAYLVNKGIDGTRLIAKGFGGSVPVASNAFEKGRVLNRRIDFAFIDK
jgi:outer membrane protein OmpA-like peptidoglycan-associated protein